MSALTDTLLQVGNAGTLTSLAAPGKALGAGSINLTSAANYPTTSTFIIAIRTVSASLVSTSNPSGEVAGTYTEWLCMLSSGTTFTINPVPVYGTDQVYAAGTNTQVFIPNSSYAWNLLIASILQDHAQKGYHGSLHDVNGNNWLTQSAVASAVNYLQLANAATGGKPTLQLTGTDSNISGSIKGKGTGLIDIDGAVPQKFFGIYNFIESGCVWTADSPGSTLNASMTAGVVWIAGKRLTVAAITAHAFTASKDTYIDFQDNGDGTANVTYTAVANNAASPALPNSATDTTNIRNAIIVSGASNIANSGSVNQGQETMVLPIVSSVPYAVTDSLGYLICPRDPNRKILGYRQSTAGFSTSSTAPVQIPGLSCPVIVPTGRKVKVSVIMGAGYDGLANNSAMVTIWDGVVGSGTQLNIGASTSSATNTIGNAHAFAVNTPAANNKTYNAALSCTGGNTASTNAGAVQPVFILVELA